MKKTLGLVMALVMILTAVSALADIPSKTTADLVVVTTTNKKVVVKVTENETKPVTDLLETLAVSNSIPYAAKKTLPEGSTYKTVLEAITLKIEGGTAEEDLVVNLAFQTNFKGKNVAVFLGAIEKDAIVEWKSVETVGKDDGSIDLTLDGEIQDWLNGREFIVLVAE